MSGGINGPRRLRRRSRPPIHSRRGGLGNRGGRVNGLGLIEGFSGEFLFDGVEELVVGEKRI